MLIFVDYEHAERYDTDSAERIQAARTWITYRLEDLSGQPCMLVRYDRLSDELLKRVGAQALFISGNGTDPSRYDPIALEPLHRAIRESGLPVFGFCGGLQAMAEALGVEVVPIEVGDDAEDNDALKKGPGGRYFEAGYRPIELHGDHPLLDGLGEAPVFRHAHGLHVPTPPAGFSVLASTAVTRLQLIVDDERRMVGTQFHPEYWTDEHQAGRTLIANFMRWAGLTA